MIGHRAALPLVVCLASFLAASAAWAAPSPTLVRVVCDDDYPPYAFRDSSGALVGIVVDRWKAWERVTGTKVELAGLPWAEALNRFDAGEADVLDTAFSTPDRRERYDFSKPYASIEVPIFVHRSLTGITSVSDLRGLRVGVKNGDAALGQLIHLGVGELSVYRSYEDIVRAAVRLDLRVFCIDKPPAIYWLYKLGVDREFRIADTMEGGAFHRAVLKGRPELFAAVEAGFARIRKAEIASIERKWLGSEIGRRVDSRSIALAAVTAAALILSLAGVSWTLRRRVAGATAELNEKLLLLEASEARLGASLAEKDILLKEVHHRVKNNLQIISSLVHLQSYALQDEGDREVFQETQQRIHAIAQLHEMLYRSADLASIDVAGYLDSLVAALASGSGRPLPELRCESLHLQLDEAVPLGLVVNELVSNSLKHAYGLGAPGLEDPGFVSVEFARRGDELLLEVRDRGPGMPEGFDPETATSMGLTLVRSLAEQLGGRLSFLGPPGLAVVLRFPAPAGETGAAPSS